ncbi:hypothetical protein NQ315_003930 [Exocentrus adspersus]|uniref:Uncharacterized protein n=1 Tax=Exocentrus adspersus TaxID=1586481 RepID=A0AAV8W0F7_9CUCU|nr:hypothetical protein NQ315_003930 [Exocentrus adspersus]
MGENITCRLCLDVVPRGYTLKENIQNLIKILTSVDVSVNNDLPKLSCSKCIFNLCFVENTRNLIIKSEEKLQSVISRNGNLHELMQIESLSQSKGELCNVTHNPSYHHAAVKEERFNPGLTEINAFMSDEIPTDHCEVNLWEDRTLDVQKSDDKFKAEIDNTEDAFDDMDITKIIFKKNNVTPYVYHCTLCNVDFQGNKMYIRHKGKHIKRTCEICGVTTRADNFGKHMTKHKLEQQICDVCGSIHKSLEGLRTHLFHFHNEKKKPYTCAECGESFKYSHRLTYHKRKVHTGFKPHQCDSCGKRFFVLGTMKKHVKLIHLKLREYHCKYCQKDYSSRYALKVHIRQHTDETPYVCELCSEGFRQLVSLKTHMVKHEKDLRRKEDNLFVGGKNVLKKDK